MIRFLAQAISENDLDIPKTPLTETRVTDALQLFFGLAAAVAVLFIAIAALRIVISRGNPQEVTKQRDAIIYAAIGLAISLTGLSIVTFVVERL